jgi:hypothetical protein
MRRAIQIFAASCLCAPLGLVAQATPEASVSSANHLFYVGYSYLARNYVHTQLNPVSGGMNGWDISFSAPHSFGRRFGLIVDASTHYQTSGFFTPQIYFLNLGPEYSAALGRSRAFVHVTVGGMFASTDVIAQTSSPDVLLIGAGGGLDFPVSSRLAWRVGADWFHGGFSTNDTNQISQIVNNNLRISTGPVFRF